MKLSDLKVKQKPFFKDDRLTITSESDNNNYFIAFNFTVDGTTKRFEVVNNNIKAAFEAGEIWAGKKL